MRRITPLSKAPLSYKEIDLITSIQDHVIGRIDLPFLELFNLDEQRNEKCLSHKMEDVWHCTNTAMHLTRQESIKDNCHKAATLYMIESQRILGSLFGIEHSFWKTFYLRQERNNDKILIALDGLFFLNDRRDHIKYEFLVQALRAISQAHYSTDHVAIDALSDALKMATLMSLENLEVWLKQAIQFKKIELNKSDL